MAFSSGVNGGLAAQRMCTAATWSEDALLEKIDKLSKNKKIVVSEKQPILTAASNCLPLEQVARLL